MNLLAVSDLNTDDVKHLLDRAISLKKRHKRGIPYQPLKGKVLGLIFEKPSTRTRVSFEVAMYHLGGDVIFMSSRDSQIGRGEPVKDTARVMSRYVDVVAIRSFDHGTVEEYASHSSVPVINGLTNLHHPCQVLADILTILEKKGGYKDIKVGWIGDGNNMANSWIEMAAIAGFQLKLACPEGYDPELAILDGARASGASVEVVRDIKDAARDADVLSTDVWASMGQEEEREKRLDAFKGYSIDANLLKLAKEDAVVMHCLPAHRGEEITEDVLEGRSSVVWDQAENRLHIQKAILEWLVVDNG